MYRRQAQLDANCAEWTLDFEDIRTPVAMEPMWAGVQVGGTHEEIVCSPIVEHGLLIVCGRRGTVYFLNRFNGDLLAEVKYGDSFVPNTAPTILGRTLVLGVGDRIVAVDLLATFRNWTAGNFRPAKKWDVACKGPVVHPLSIFFKPGEENEARVYALEMTDSSTTTLLALSLATGESVWPERKILPCVASMPAIDRYGNALLLGSDNHVYRVAAPGEVISVAASRMNMSVSPIWHDDALYYFEEGYLSSCRADSRGLGSAARTSETNLFGVRAFAASNRGFLVAHGKGLSHLTLSGKHLWTSHAGFEPIQGAPIIAGTCGIAVSFESSIAYVCDFGTSSLRYHEIPLPGGRTRTSPAFCGNVIYSASLSGTVSAVRLNSKV